MLERLNKEEGLSVLLVEQNANLAMHIASRVYLLETGRIVASGIGRRTERRRLHPQGVPGVLMELFLQRLVDGLSQGSVYALIALGLVIIYRGTGHLNFAQGEMALFCTYVVYQFGEWGIPIGIAVLMGMGVGFLLGATAEVTLIRPIARSRRSRCSSSRSGCSSSSTGSTVPSGGPAAAQHRRGQQAAVVPEPVPQQARRLRQRVRRGHQDPVASACSCWCWCSPALLFLLFNKTKLGLAMRAVASNAESAKLVGIRTNRVLMVSWGIAAAIGALGGVVFAGINANVNLGLMFTVFIYGSAAATLGGFDSPGGAVIGGLIIGVIENMAAGYSAEWVGQEMKVGVALRGHPRRAARETVRPVRHGEGGTGMKSLVHHQVRRRRQLGHPPASSAAVLVYLMFWIPTSRPATA